MMKKSNGKSNKTFSKTKCSDLRLASDNPKELSFLEYKCEIIKLEHMIKHETAKRIEGENNIMRMLKHLEQTKKSKLPCKPEGLRLASPCKEVKEKENEDLVECKNTLAALKSEREEYRIQRQMKETEKQKEMEQLIARLDCRNYVNGRLDCFSEELGNIRKEQEQFRQEISQLFIDIRRETDEMRQFMPSILFSQISEDIKTNMKNAMKDLKQVVLGISQQMDLKMQRNLQCIDDQVKQSIEKINSINSQVSLSFNKIQNQVKNAKNSINETKTMIKTQLSIEEDSDGQGESQCSQVNPETNTWFKRKQDQKMNWLEGRVGSLQARLGAIYESYFSIPFHQA